MLSLARRSLGPCLTLCSVVALLGCPGDDGNEESSEGSSSGVATSSTSGTTTAATSSTSVADGDSGTTTSGSSSGSSSSSGDGDSTSSDGGDSSSSGGMEICEVNLPPPPACPAFDAPPPVIIEGEWPSPWSQGSNGLAAPEEPDFGGFIADPDLPIQFECSTFAQDCPAGEKCMPWNNSGGGSWNATRCSPLSAMPDQVGDVCTVEGSGTSGIDSCDAGLMCWGVDAMTNEGTCTELCGCTEINPVCNTANTTCAISNDGALAICLPVCNPLDTDFCPAGEACYPLGDTFLCAPDASGALGGAGDPCEFINACDAGHFCLSAGAVPGCAGAVGCCSPACTAGDDSPCLGSQTCQPWFEAGSAPDECLAMAGACALPA